MANLIEIRDMYKIYAIGDEPVHALDGVSLSVDEGEFVAIMGASGSGKSTMLNILGCLDVPTSGSYLLDSVEVASRSATELAHIRNTKLGFVFQNFNLLPRTSALENVELANQLSENPLDAETIMKEVGLEERMDHFPAQLSGGEQQRVSIARAIAKNPKLMLCDEPTGALDYNTGKTILKLLQDMCRNKGMTVIVITHNQAITPMADRIINIKNGQVTDARINEHPVSIDEIEW